MLVILRIAIGWHFLYQGLWKLDNPSFTSAGFLSQAKGPWAERFHALIPDYYGHERLDRDKLFAKWDDFLARAKETYKLSEQQAAAASRVLEAKKGVAGEFFRENREAIDSYFYDLERWSEASREPRFRDIEFQQKRTWDNQKALAAQAAGWLSQVDAWSAELSDGVRGVLTDEQRRAAEIRVSEASLEPMDRFITYTNIAIGFCLLVGLLTRFASFSGAVFLLSIVLSQPEWPGVYPPAPPAAGRSLIVTKEVIEMVAMFALAALPVGRWGGLDFFVHHFVTRRLFGIRDSV